MWDFCIVSVACCIIYLPVGVELVHVRKYSNRFSLVCPGQECLGIKTDCGKIKTSNRVDREGYDCRTVLPKADTHVYEGMKTWTHLKVQKLRVYINIIHSGDTPGCVETFAVRKFTLMQRENLGLLGDCIWLDYCAASYYCILVKCKRI